MQVSTLLFSLFVMTMSASVLAQSDCPATIESALATVGTQCNATPRNEVCYGNNTLIAAPRDLGTDLQFERSGDLVSIADIASLQLSPYHESPAEWGVAVMKVQANLPDTLPGQNVTFLLFGNVSVSDATSQDVEVSLTANRAVNVREKPTTIANVLMALKDEQVVTATGRLPDLSWIRIRLDDGVVGWVDGNYLTGDSAPLLSVEPNAPPPTPMQAFYFKTSIGDAPCLGAPDSGILIQTPHTGIAVQLRANQVDFKLGSTVFLQAVPGEAMQVSVLDGHAEVTAYGVTQIVPTGTMTTIPLDSTGVAAGPPAYATTYDLKMVQALPLASLLPEQITPQSGVADSAIPQAIDIANGLVPDNGNWVYTETTTHAPDPVCGIGGNLRTGHVETLNSLIVFNADRSTITFEGVHHESQSAGNTSALVLYRDSETSYGGQYFSGDWEITFTTPTTFSGTAIGWRANPSCSWDRAYSGYYQP